MELIMDRQIVWDKAHIRQIDQAKKLYWKFKREGYVITLEDKKTPIKRFNPNLETIVIIAKKVKGHVMKFLSEKGDERLVWDMDSGPEAKQAKNKFNELIKKGYKAYSVDHKGEKNRKITEFDVEAEEILMVPETIKG